MTYKEMNLDEEKEYLEIVLKAYANELVIRKSCKTINEALIQSKIEIEQISNFFNKKLLFLDKIPIGFAWISDYQYNDEKALFLVDIQVKEEYRNKGYGKDILTEIIKYSLENNYKSILLSVTKSNVVACHLYDKFNFKVLEENDFSKEMIKEL